MEPTNDDLHKRLNPGGRYSEEEQRVRDWVYQNREMFIEQSWALDEIVFMARMVEIASDEAIYSVLSHFQDALRGSHVENRMAVQDFNLEMAIEQFNELKRNLEEPRPLKALWDDLVKEHEKGE